jgi:hypothetical protein
MASNAAKEFTLDFGEVVFNGDVGSQEAEADLIIEDSLAFAFGRDGNGLQEGEGIGYLLAKGIEVAMITAGRAEAGDLSLDGRELAWPVTGVGAKLPGVLVAGLAATFPRWGPIRYAPGAGRLRGSLGEGGVRCGEHGR